MQVECFINLLLTVIQHISFNSVCHFRIGLVLFLCFYTKLWIEMWDMAASRASVFRAFSQENIAQLSIPQTVRMELVILMIFISMDCKIEATRLSINDDSEPYSKHLVLSFFYYMTINH